MRVVARKYSRGKSPGRLFLIIDSRPSVCAKLEALFATGKKGQLTLWIRKAPPRGSWKAPKPRAKQRRPVVTRVRKGRDT